MRFSIVIPNYNSEKWIKKLLDSIKVQTYKNYEIVIVDDMSTDKSVEIITEYMADNPTILIGLYVSDKKLYNGGTRNVGVEYAEGDYIVFADCDDWFYSERGLEELSNVIDANNNPDLIRLPYHFKIKGEGDVPLKEKTLEELTHSIFVAPWTKCVKRELFVPFPENTLIEDVSQHIAQLDVVETYARCSIPIMVWNRANPEAISADNRVYTRDSKRYSSIYRNIADLIDLKVNKSYCKEEREKRINWYLDKVHNNLEDTIVKRA